MRWTGRSPAEELIGSDAVSRTPLVVGTVVVAIVGGGVLASRWMDHDARSLAARLLRCPYQDVEVETISTGAVEVWRVEGCGTRGKMTCDPADAGCFIEPQE